LNILSLNILINKNKNKIKNVLIGRKGKNTLINASLLFTITKKAHQEIGKLLNLSKSMIGDIISRAGMIKSID